MTRKKIAGDATATIGRTLNQAAKSARNMLDRRLAKVGTSHAVWVILSMLEREGSVIQRELAEKMFIEGPTLTRHLERMEREGLIVRRPDAKDRRAARTEVTVKGRALRHKLVAIMLEGQSQLEAGFSQRELALLRRMLDRITANCDPAE